MALIFAVAMAVAAVLCLTAIVLGYADLLARWGPLALVPLPPLAWWIWRTRPRGA